MLLIIVSLRANQPEWLFYDGHCALCHWTVKFVLKHDADGTAFRFAPLQGGAFQALVPAGQRVALPDSIVILTADSVLLTRSDAFVHILRRLGGGWKFVGGIVNAIPRVLRNGAYDFVARIRYRVFGTRDDLCPVIPPEWRARFDL